VPKRAPRALVRELLNTLQGSSRILIVTHNDPDPDAMASAVGLQFVLSRRATLNSDAAFGGIVARVENRAMIRLLDLRIFSLASLDLADYDACALVDCQPATVRFPLPRTLPIKVVIDHHPFVGTASEGTFVDICSDYGATSTIIAEYARSCRLRIPKPLATALLYGIKSDTRDLGGTVCQADIHQYTNLFKRADIRLLSQIEHEKVPRDYFRVMGKAIGSARLYGGSVLVSPLGDIPNAAFVAQAADYFLRLDGVELVLCTGVFKGNIVISARADSARASAAELLQEAVGSDGAAGGHATAAGGQIRAEGLSRELREDLHDRILSQFVLLSGNKAGEYEFPFADERESLEKP